MSQSPPAIAIVQDAGWTFRPRDGTRTGELPSQQGRKKAKPRWIGTWCDGFVRVGESKKLTVRPDSDILSIARTLSAMNEALGLGIFCDADQQLGRHGTYECQERWNPDVEAEVMAPESISRGMMPSLRSKLMTLNEALEWIIEEFGGGESLERLENEISFERGVFHLYGRSEEDAKLHREHVGPYEQARDNIVSKVKQGVIRLLRSGNFIGIGLKMPIVANSVSGFIVPVFWNVLELDFDRMIATSEDMEYRNVQIIPIDRCTEEEVRAINRRLKELARPDPLDAHAGHPAPGTSTDDELPMKSAPAEEAALVEAEMEEGAEPSLIPESHTETHSFPGRPSKMRAVLAKLEERAEACQLAESSSAESRWLEDWVAAEFPHEQVPKAKSIRNKIGSRYRELKMTSPAQN